MARKFNSATGELDEVPDEVAPRPAQRTVRKFNPVTGELDNVPDEAQKEYDPITEYVIRGMMDGTLPNFYKKPSFLVRPGNFIWKSLPYWPVIYTACMIFFTNTYEGFWRILWAAVKAFFVMGILHMLTAWLDKHRILKIIFIVLAALRVAFYLCLWVRIILPVSSPVSSTTQAETAVLQPNYYCTATTLNVRERPASNAGAIGQLKKNDECHVYSYDATTGFATIEFNGRKGYVKAEYLRPGDASGANSVIPPSVYARSSGNSGSVQPRSKKEVDAATNPQQARNDKLRRANEAFQRGMEDGSDGWKKHFLEAYELYYYSDKSAGYKKFKARADVLAENGLHADARFFMEYADKLK